MDSFIHRTKKRLKRTKIELDELYPMDTFSGSFHARIPSENANQARNPGFLRKTCMDSFIHRTKKRLKQTKIELDELYPMDTFSGSFDARTPSKNANQAWNPGFLRKTCMDSFIHRTKNRLKRTKIELDELYPMDTFSGSFDARIPSENANEARNPGFLRKTCMDSFIHRTKTRKCHRMIELDEVYRMNAFPAQLDASMYPKSTNQNAKTRFFVVKPIAIRPQHVSNKLIHLCR